MTDYMRLHLFLILSLATKPFLGRVFWVGWLRLIWFGLPCYPYCTPLAKLVAHHNVGKGPTSQ